MPGDFPTIQAAIDAAEDGDGVLVFPGVYHESIDFRGKAIIVTSFGGPQSATITDASAYRVVFDDGEDERSQSIGFTITRDGESIGAGMLIDSSSPTVRRCRIIGNVVTGSGGGVQCTGAPAFVDCTFQDNAAGGNGGGVFTAGDPTFDRCTFDGNEAIFGGAIYAACCGSDPILRDCRFVSNTAVQSGGGVFGIGSSVLTASSRFEDNVAGGDGGGAFLSGGGHAFMLCSFSGNRAVRGSAIHLNFVAGATRVDGCLFQENVSSVSGAVYTQGSNPALADCTFDGNSAGSSGGGMADVDQSSPAAARCVFSHNTAAAGGAIHSASGSDAAVRESLFCANSPDDIGGEWIDEGDNEFILVCEGDCLADVDGSGIVDFADVLALLVAWGPCPGCREDLDQNRVVDFADVLIVLAAWGPCP